MKKIIITAITGLAVWTCAIKAIAIDIDSAREQLQQQLMNNGYDFMGLGAENLYFKLRNSYSSGSIPKSIWFDACTLKEQIGLSIKCFSDNDLIYIVLGGTGTLIKLKKIGYLLRLLR